MEYLLYFRLKDHGPAYDFPREFDSLEALDECKRAFGDRYEFLELKRSEKGYRKLRR